MRIKKIINNNVVMTFWHNGEEALIMGKGIGFDKVEGDNIKETAIEKVFLLSKLEHKKQLKALIYREDPKYFFVVKDLVDILEKKLQRKLDEAIYLLLIDHLLFAVKRVRENIPFVVPLSLDIHHLYPQEYLMGEYARTFINKKLTLALPESEALFIALHIVNASDGADMYDTLRVTKLTKQLLDMLIAHFKLNIQVDAIEYLRLLTHLRFFAQRVFKDVRCFDEADTLSQFILESYQDEATGIKQLANFVLEHYEYRMSEKEQAYLVMHVHRVIKTNSAASLGV